MTFNMSDVLATSANTLENSDMVMEAMLGKEKPQPLVDGEHFLCPVEKLTLYKNEEFREKTGRDQPYKILPKLKLEQLKESIATSGLIEALTVRNDPVDEDKYQILAGRNRYLAITAGELMTEIPCIYRVCETEDDARKILIETNEARRESISEVERAFAIAFRLDSIKELNKSKTLGRPSDEIVGEEFGMAPTSVHNYVQITNMIPQFQDMMEDGKISVITGAHIGLMPPGLQEAFWEAIDGRKKLTDKTVKKVASAARGTKYGVLSVVEIEELLSGSSDAARPNKITIPKDYRNLVPHNDEMDDFFVDNWIKNALLFYAEHMKKELEKGEQESIPEGQTSWEDLENSVE